MMNHATTEDEHIARLHTWTHRTYVSLEALHSTRLRDTPKIALDILCERRVYFDTSTYAT